MGQKKMYYETDYQDQLNYIVENAEDFKSEWEQDFAKNMKGRNFSSLTINQKEKVLELYEKI